MTLFHHSLLAMLLIAWGALTGILVLLLILRGIAGMHEDNLLYLNSGDQGFANETKDAQIKQQRLVPYIRAFGWMSGVSTVLVAGLFIYQSLTQGM